ncbi:fimbrial protein [Siccibacter turicensis]|uniref:fimbrial protein n=1 Tax=Siccibacter turicensis TaxID=357233 RepID=UPI0010214771|nr:fimbrial protein [Siccibacter turicensis]
MRCLPVIAGLFFSSVLVPVVSIASDASITMTATVVASPCTLDTAVSQLTVDLGDYYADQLSKPKSAVGYKTFPLTLKDCPEGTTKVVATFTGVDEPAGDWITLFTNTGTAKNVGIMLKGDTSLWIGGAIKNGTQLTQTVKADHTVTWPMESEMGTSTGNATPGTVHAVITVSFTYQ